MQVSVKNDDGSVPPNLKAFNAGSACNGDIGALWYVAISEVAVDGG